MLLLSKQDIKSIFTMQDAIEAARQAFKVIALEECELPLRTNIQAAEEGCFLFMPAYAKKEETAALKVVNIFPRNVENNLPTSVGTLLLIDGKTGIVTSVLDGTHVTRMRTGAATGLAFDMLARRESKIRALIGTGGQAASQLEAMLSVRKLEIVKVYDVNQKRTEQFVAQIKKEAVAYGTEIRAVVSSDEVVENADLLVTVTSSHKPVFDGKKIKKGATVSCVGAYQPHMQEMDPVILQRASKIYFDSMDAVLQESGDILIPLKQKLISEQDFTGNLGEVILGELPGRQNDDEIIVFETVGLAAQDLITAKHIYEKAIENGAGTVWE